MPDSTMLRFIQILPNVSISGDFFLKDLPGSGKRIDVLCRILSACFEWGPSTWQKNKIEVIAVIGDSIILRFQYPGASLPSGEKAWAQVLKESLKGSPTDFVHAYEGDLESIIIEVNNAPESNLWILHEDGERMDINEMQISRTDNSFMLGDHRGFNSQTEKLISRYALRKMSLGKISYLSSHCAAHIISEIERRIK